MAAPKKADKGEGQDSRLSLTLATDEELQQGSWESLPCGIEAQLAPSNTEHFFNVQQRTFRKYGGRDAKELADVKPGKRWECTLAVIAGANFIGFRAPGGESEIEVNGQVFADTLEGRIGLMKFPTIREEVADRLAVLDSEYAKETEDAAKN